MRVRVFVHDNDGHDDDNYSDNDQSKCSILSHATAAIHTLKPVVLGHNLQLQNESKNK